VLLVHVIIALLPKLFNPLNAELNPVCHLLALLGAHHILHVSGIRITVRIMHVQLNGGLQYPSEVNF